jgi:hypothetical protein
MGQEIQLFLLFSFVVVGGLTVFIAHLLDKTPKHTWIYRNPSDRTCSVCGRNEVEFCRDIESWNRTWWEVFNDGDLTRHGIQRNDQ